MDGQTESHRMHNQELAVEKKLLRFELVTEMLWIAGQSSTLHRRLLDALNNEHSDVLPIEDVSVARSIQPDQSVATSPFGNLRIDGVLLALPADGTAEPLARDPMTWTPKRPQRMLAAIGPYVVEGDLYIVATCSPKDCLLSLGERFVALADAVVVAPDGRAIRRGVVFLNRSRIDLLMPLSPPSRPLSS